MVPWGWERFIPPLVRCVRGIAVRYTGDPGGTSAIGRFGDISGLQAAFSDI